MRRLTRLRRLAWLVGLPLRAAILALIRVYRLTLSYGVTGRCRFYPSCSAYAEEAIRSLGVVRGGALAVWRLLRCSPLSKGGVDCPPAGGPGDPPWGNRRSHRGVYDGAIHSRERPTPPEGVAA